MAERRLQPDSVAWWGHATVEIDVGGTRLLTDPVLTRRVGHLVRRRGDNPPPEILSPDAVLISHLHADHTHLPSLRILEGGVQIVVPRGAPAHLRALRRLGNPLVEISVGDHVDIGTVRVTAVPAVHDGRRWRRGPHDVEAIGYLIEGSSVVYFAGDTAPFDAMSTLVPQCDLALLPVGGWGPTLGDGHMDPRAAALAADAVGARFAVPIHYGTLWPVGFGRIRPHLFDDPGDDFVAHAAALGVPATALAQTVRWPIKH